MNAADASVNGQKVMLNFAEDRSRNWARSVIPNSQQHLYTLSPLPNFSSHFVVCCLIFTFLEKFCNLKLSQNCWRV